MLKNLITFRNLSATASSILLRYDWFFYEIIRGWGNFFIIFFVFQLFSCIFFFTCVFFKNENENENEIYRKKERVAKKKYFHYSSSSLSMDIIYYDPWILRKVREKNNKKNEFIWYKIIEILMKFFKILWKIDNHLINFFIINQYCWK